MGCVDICTWDNKLWIEPIEQKNYSMNMGYLKTLTSDQGNDSFLRHRFYFPNLNNKQKIIIKLCDVAGS